MKLLIVESPAKARTIAGYLGPGYRVRATLGHVRDLPAQELAVDVDATFRPKYATLPKKRSLMSKLRKEAARCDEVLIATDPDREGEIIAHHVAESLRRVNRQVARVTFREITRAGLREGIARPRPVDRKLVAAQQARRVMDRLVGYKVSPFLWRAMEAGSGLSAGRVQSAALRLVCERELAIADFVPQEYWSLDALFETPAGERFTARLHRLRNRVVGSPAKKTTQHVIPDEAAARRLRDEARARSYRVSDVARKTIRRPPPPPFTTSTLQQAASSRLRMNTRTTMRAAQQLYEGVELEGDERVGLITYMRTDAVRLAPEATEAIRALIAGTFGREYLPERPHAHSKKQSALAQDAHEAIRPTDVGRRPDAVRRFLTPEQYRLYRLIWERAVASQMAAAVVDRTTVDVTSDDGAFVFRAVGQVVVFPGFTRLYAPDEAERPKKGKGKPDEEADASQPLPPSLRAGLPVELIELTPKQHHTKPPPRYTEATLVRALEEQGIGRPSTYSSTVQTIRSRGYATVEKRLFHATDLGLRVNALLVEHFPSLFDLGFTAHMEAQLDQIAEGRLNYKRTLEAFYHDQLMRALDAARGRQHLRRDTPPPAATPRSTAPARSAAAPPPSAPPPPEPPPPRRTPFRRRGPAPLPTDERCPTCNKPLLQREGKYGPFLSCSGFPSCRYTRSLKPKASREQPPPVSADAPACPACGKPMVLRRGPRGSFYGCSGYPGCRKTRPHRS